MEAVSREIVSLSLCLDELRIDCFTWAVKYPEALRKHLAEVLLNCDILTQQMKSLLLKLLSNCLGRKVQWSASSRAEMNKLRSSLECHKSAMEIALTVGSISLLTEIRKDVSAIISADLEIKSDVTATRQQMMLISKELFELRGQINEFPQAVNGGISLMLQEFLKEAEARARVLTAPFAQEIATLDDEEGPGCRPSYVSSSMQPQRTYKRPLSLATGARGRVVSEQHGFLIGVDVNLAYEEVVCKHDALLNTVIGLQKDLKQLKTDWEERGVLLANSEKHVESLNAQIEKIETATAAVGAGTAIEDEGYAPRSTSVRSAETSTGRDTQVDYPIHKPSRFTGAGSDMLNWHVLHTLRGHTDWVTAVAFSPDGRLVASASLDTTVRIWGSATGATCHTLMGHESWVNAMTFSPDGSLIASASSDTTVRVWDLTTGLTRNKLERPPRLEARSCFNSRKLKIRQG